MKKLWRVPAATLAAVALLTGSAVAVSAHQHVIGSNGQVIANGQNHPAFGFDAATGTYLSCVTNALPPDYGPAWYGIETAHHGSDSGDPGKGDGCYAADSSPSGEGDDVNPAID